MPNLLQEPFSLTNLTTGQTEADGTANAWSDIWAYTVPTGIGHILLPEHTISAYLEDASAQVGNGTCQIRIEIRDTSQMDNKVVFGPVLYATLKEFADANLVAKLRLAKPVGITEQMLIVFQVKDDGAIDASDSYFELGTIRVRQSLV